MLDIQEQSRVIFFTSQEVGKIEQNIDYYCASDFIVFAQESEQLLKVLYIHIYIVLHVDTVKYFVRLC